MQEYTLIPDGHHCYSSGWRVKLSPSRRDLIASVAREGTESTNLTRQQPPRRADSCVERLVLQLGPTKDAYNGANTQMLASNISY
mmetsp:Transcript_12013/g.19240  ORF Transcript_12013/g.19240 Transcript_12013/m.19240 type:complete len:85 (+) Transcript_12013:410-664(+)